MSVKQLHRRTRLRYKNLRPVVNVCINTFLPCFVSHLLISWSCYILNDNNYTTEYIICRVLKTLRFENCIFSVFIPQVACMQFINIVVHSVEDMNFRVHLQFDFTKLCLDDYLDVSWDTVWQEKWTDRPNAAGLLNIQPSPEQRLSLWHPWDSNHRKAVNDGFSITWVKIGLFCKSSLHRWDQCWPLECETSASCSELKK